MTGEAVTTPAPRERVSIGRRLLNLLKSDQYALIPVLIVVFIQKRPQGLFAVKGRSAEA